MTHLQCACTCTVHLCRACPFFRTPQNDGLHGPCHAVPRTNETSALLGVLWGESGRQVESMPLGAEALERQNDVLEKARVQKRRETPTKCFLGCRNLGGWKRLLEAGRKRFRGMEKDYTKHPEVVALTLEPGLPDARREGPVSRDEALAGR